MTSENCIWKLLNRTLGRNKFKCVHLVIMHLMRVFLRDFAVDLHDFIHVQMSECAIRITCEL